MRKIVMLVLLGCGLAATCFAESEYYVKKGAERLPKPLRKLNGSGIKALGEQRYGDAAKIYSEFIRKAPKMALGYANRGTAYMHLEQYDKASSDYEKAVTLDPSMREIADPSAPLVRLGMESIDKGDMPAAERQFLKAVGKNPGNATAWNELAFLSAQKRDYAGCIERASKALKIDPRYAQALANRGACYSGVGEFAKALKDLDESISI